MNRALAFLTLLSLSLTGLSQLKTARIFSENMIIQRNQPIQIWGSDDPGNSITIQFAGQSTSVTADKKGNWSGTLEAMKSGGPFELTISSDETISLKNIYLGDIWVCSGQSNMEWPVRITNNAEEEIASADYPMIRHFTVPKSTAFKPQSDLPGGEWEVTTPETAGRFTAVGYYFGRELHKETQVPIGLLHTSWGGTNVETWIPLSKLKEMPDYKSAVQVMEQSGNLRKQLDEMASEAMKKIGEIPASDPGFVDGKALWTSETTDYSSWKASKLPGLWENDDLKGFDGIVWYQKDIELSAEEASENIEIHLGRIDDSDWTWINGNLIGEMSMSYDQNRVYKGFPQSLKTGKNSIVVRVEDTGGGGGLWGPVDEMYVQTNSRKIPISGQWKRKIGTGSVIVNESPNDFPTQLFNTMIHPIINLPVAGAIWYQGESNAWNAKQYQTSFPAMIESWRSAWEQPEMPFYFVQLANFMQANEQPVDDNWAELREAQLMTLRLPATGMASAIDIGEAGDIHPRNKQDVGKRLANIALNQYYGQDELVYSGPIYKSHEIKDGKVFLSFDHIGSGLMAQDRYGYLKGFSIAGEDKKFVWAQATIMGDQVIVKSEAVQKPVAVRYGWSANPDDINLYNQEGLPASPFRTDSWKGITEEARYTTRITLDE